MWRSIVVFTLLIAAADTAGAESVGILGHVDAMPPTDHAEVARGVLSSLDSLRSTVDFSSSSLDDDAIYGGLLGPDPVPAPAVEVVEPEPEPEPVLPWQPALAILLALVIASSSGRMPE